MRAVRGGTLAEAQIQEGASGQKLLFFELKEGVQLQEARLARPQRWVVELGNSHLLLGPVEEEMPFQPYPIKLKGFSVEAPPLLLSPASGRSAAAQAFNRCFEAWTRGEHRRALQLGKALAGSTDPAARVLRAEIERSLLRAKQPLNLERALLAFQEAERALRGRPLQAVRQALGAVEVFREWNLLEKAELYLQQRRRSYQGTPAEPSLLAGLIRLLFELGEPHSAALLLEQLQEMKGPEAGQALMALAAMAYGEGEFQQAWGLFKRLRREQPALLSSAAVPLFQAAELALYYEQLREAEALYALFLEIYPEEEPHWVARIRVAELLAERSPEQAALRFAQLATELRETEGQDLAFLRLARFSEDRNLAQRILKNLSHGRLSPYALSELLVQSSRLALSEGDIKGAYIEARRLWTQLPLAPALKRAPLLFDRLLLLRLLEAQKPAERLRLYFDQRPRVEQHLARAYAHLLVGRALRELSMLKESLLILQRGVGGRADEREPESSAWLYHEIAAVLREQGDAFRLRQILDYLEQRKLKPFDDYEYWLAKGELARMEGKLKEGQAIFKHGLNGPLSSAERVDMARRFTELSLLLKEPDRALKALEAIIEIHDTAKKPLAPLSRRDARWRGAEIEIQRERWPQAVKALRLFLEEYPDDSVQDEARFYLGRGLHELGEFQGARAAWYQSAQAHPDSLFGGLANTELKLLEWEQKVIPNIKARLGLSAP